MNLFDQDFEDEEENQQTESVEDVSGIVGEVGSPPVETQTEFIPEITRTANDDDVAEADEALIALRTIAGDKCELYTDCPPAGIYTDIDEKVYRKFDAMNASTLVWGMVSMEHLKGAIDGKITHKKTDDLEKGRAIHAKLLEPKKFDELYQVCDRCSGVYKTGEFKGERCRAVSTSYVFQGKWYCNMHAPKGCEEPENVLTPDVYFDIMQINEKVKSHDVVNMLRSPGGYEATIIWSWNGIRSKVRTDKLILPTPERGNHAAVLCVKKVRLARATDKACAKQIDDLHYYIKAAFYVDAAAYVLGVPADFFWIFVEDTFPYSINVIQADSETLECGRFEYQRILKDYLECIDRNMWPGCSYSRLKKRNAIKLGGLPLYTRKRYAMVRGGGEENGR